MIFNIFFLKKIGFSPVLYEVPPCKIGRHISADDKQKMLDARYSIHITHTYYTYILHIPITHT